MKPVERITDPSLCALEGVSHGFFTRQGGVSVGAYESLNCGWGTVGDERANVAENRNRVGAALGVAGGLLFTAYQTHGTEVLVLDKPWTSRERPRVDGLVTSTPGIALGVLTADCAPILFADAEARVIAAAHAGWRGALAGIVESTLLRMEQLGASRPHITAVVGPAISRHAYEVGTEFFEEFLERDSRFSQFFSMNGDTGRWHFDLPTFVCGRLKSAGIRNPRWNGCCTVSDETRFFSYRRQIRNGETDYGRQVSAILLLREGD